MSNKKKVTPEAKQKYLPMLIVGIICLVASPVIATAMSNLSLTLFYVCLGQKMQDEAPTVQTILVFICCVAIGVALTSYSSYKIYKSRR